MYITVYNKITNYIMTVNVQTRVPTMFEIRILFLLYLCYASTLTVAYKFVSQEIGCRDSHGIAISSTEVTRKSRRDIMLPYRS